MVCESSRVSPDGLQSSSSDKFSPIGRIAFVTVFFLFYSRDLNRDFKVLFGTKREPSPNRTSPH